MKILYKNNSIKKQINKMLLASDKKVQERLEDIMSSFEEGNNFSYILTLKYLNPHQLKGDKKKTWAVKVDNTKWRIIFYLCNEKDEPIDDENFDILHEASNLKTIMIMEVSEHYGK